MPTATTLDKQQQAKIKTSKMSSTAAGGGGKAQRRASGKHSHSRSYPRGVGVDFKKLAGLTLLNYIDHHGACVCFVMIVVLVVNLSMCGALS